MMTINQEDPPGGPADKRTAAGLVIQLSSYVMTATLAVLGAQAVVATFVLDKRTYLGPFKIVSGAATIALILSIILGGRGVAEIIKCGALGDWKTGTRNGLFNWQAFLTLLGAVLVVLSAFMGHPKPV